MVVVPILPRIGWIHEISSLNKGYTPITEEKIRTLAMAEQLGFARRNR